jgi:hypothetical protein
MVRFLKQLNFEEAAFSVILKSNFTLIFKNTLIFPSDIGSAFS